MRIPLEHHNPSIHVSSTTTREWHAFVYNIRIVSTHRTNDIQGWEQNVEWTDCDIPSPESGTRVTSDGSIYLFYHSGGLDLPSPSCFYEGIAMQVGRVADACHEPNNIPLFGHNREDPSVFIDHHGNYYAIQFPPCKCVPKFNQGGHAWSKDGITWSVVSGHFDKTVQFTDGTCISVKGENNLKWWLEPMVNRSLWLLPYQSQGFDGR